MRNGLCARFLLLTTIGATAVSVVAADALAELEMGSYTNAPVGKEIAAGDYDAAIASASSPFWKRDDDDALIAATAARCNAELVTCDQRALPVYERYGVRTRVLP